MKNALHKFFYLEKRTYDSMTWLFSEPKKFFLSYTPQHRLAQRLFDNSERQVLVIFQVSPVTEPRFHPDLICKIHISSVRSKKIEVIW